MQAILFASASKKGFGLHTTWGHGLLMARKSCADGRCCWSGPCYTYISGTMSLGLGEPRVPAMWTLCLIFQPMACLS